MDFDRHGKRCAFIACAVLMVSGTRHVAAAEYTITDLGTLGGISSGTSGINNASQIVGGSTIASGALHPFLWENSVMQDLGAPSGYVVATASSLNDQARVVGTAEGQYQAQYAYLCDDGVWSYLGTLPGPGLDYSSAADINSANQIVGYSFTLGPGSAHRAWIWEDGVMTDLGTLGGEESSASAINEMGQVVGWATIGGSSYNPHAFLWENGLMSDLGTLPDYTKSSASDINGAGQVCGTSSRPVPPYFTAHRACMWDNGTVIDLGLLPGYAKSLSAGINAQGQVVGYLGVSLSGGASAAFIWEDGVMANLNMMIPPGSGWDLKSASAINDAGQIVGWGQAPDGEYRGFLLTPIAGCPADINGDSFVDVLDLLAVLAAWGNSGGVEDINGDGFVDVQDLLQLLSGWGPCP